MSQSPSPSHTEEYSPSEQASTIDLESESERASATNHTTSIEDWQWHDGNNNQALPQHLFDQIQRNCEKFNTSEPSCLLRIDGECNLSSREPRKPSPYIIPGTTDVVPADCYVLAPLKLQGASNYKIVVVHHANFNGGRATIIVRMMKKDARGKVRAVQNNGKRVWCVWNPELANGTNDINAERLEKGLAPKISRRGPQPRNQEQTQVQGVTCRSEGSGRITISGLRGKIAGFRDTNETSQTSSSSTATTQPQPEFIFQRSENDNNPVHIPATMIESAKDLFDHALCNDLVDPETKVLRIRQKGANKGIHRDVGMYFERCMEGMKASVEAGESDVCVVVLDSKKN